MEQEEEGKDLMILPRAPFVCTEVENQLFMRRVSMVHLTGGEELQEFFGRMDKVGGKEDVRLTGRLDGYC